MKLSDETIKEIAELLDSGMDCFYNPSLSTIEYHPDIEDPNFEPEFWIDTLDKIDSERDKYVRFEKMCSNERFRVMENFIHSLEDSDLKNQLYSGISKPKPFGNFKNLIARSDYRKDWFDFKDAAYFEFVKNQAELND
ncbi:UPF0158 family protein [Maribacter flavus]|uniref:Uncharacterized protein n=1 Tax=Maribacter flavus TaxID=1658664 RepID=A0A5B2TZY9_9FLAO|nr:UPF0158 family protein [Maribacter flavus]KAA2219909.1 hypothetical protein F0361_10075 [Maribacter flavus]